MISATEQSAPTYRSGEEIKSWLLGRISPMPTHVPIGWELLRLTSVARLESGHTPSRRRPDYWEGDIPWVSLHDSDRLDGAEILETAQTMGPLGLANSSARLLPKGTVVLSRTATVGKATMLGREMATSQDFANYVCGPRVHNRYLVQLFRYMQAEWMRLMAGSTHNSIYMPVFRALEVLLPPIDEQRAIADALGDVDVLLVELTRLIAKKRDLKQAAMQQLLTGKTRLPGFGGEWVVRRLGEVASIDADNLPADTPSHYGFNYISLEDVDFGVMRGFTEQVFESAPSRARRRLRRNDVLVSTVRPNLRSHLLFAIEDSNWVCSTGFSVVRCMDGIAEPAYVFFHLFTDGVAKQIDMLLTGSNYPAINGGDVRALEMPFPSLEEQTAIATVLSDMDAEIAALEARLAKTRALKQGMMQELLTGKTRLV